MATGMKRMAYIIAAFGVKSFIYGIVAENMKPQHGNPQTSAAGDRIICKFPSDPAVVLGFLSVASVVIAVLFGQYSCFYPYKGRSVPRFIFVRSNTFFVFYLLTWALSMLATGMILWVTIIELHHLTNNVHKDLNTMCPTAKPGLFGGAAFLALSASLFWLICLMLVDDVRTNYFEQLEDSKTHVLKTDYDEKEQSEA